MATSYSATSRTSTIRRARCKPARRIRTTRSEFACTRTRTQTAKCLISSPRFSASRARCLLPKLRQESFAISKVFKLRPTESNLDILPYALDVTTWQNLCNNSGSNSYRWNPESKTVSVGADDFVEVNLFPQGTGSPGNRGTVDIGSSNNSTADIAQQILYGISPADLAYHGGKLEFDSNGKLYLNGDTGISAGVKDELASIIGKPRIIPIFSSVSGNGNNAMYTIVKWQGIRIMAVKLTGSMSQKHVTIQVAPIVTHGVIPATASGTSEYVYSPVVLIK